MQIIKYSPYGNKHKFIRVVLWNSILENDVIHDALKVTCNKILKLRGRSVDIDTFGDKALPVWYEYKLT